MLIIDGPWEMQFDPAALGWCQIVSPSWRKEIDTHNVICYLPWNDSRGPYNAKLIEAAPKLLELLRRGSDIIGGLEADCDEAGVDAYPARHWWQDVDKVLDELEKYRYGEIADART